MVGFLTVDAAIRFTIQNLNETREDVLGKLK